MKNILFFIFLSVKIFAYSGNYDSNGEVANFRSYEFENRLVTNNGAIARTFDSIANYSTIDFSCVSNTGSIPTASVHWLLKDGTIITRNVIYSGYPITNFKGNIVQVRIINRTGGSITCTGNIFLTKRHFERQKKAKPNYNFNVGTSGTFVTVTPATQGYWSVRPTQDIQVNSTGASGPYFPIYANEPANLDTYFKAGDQLRFKATTTTTNLKVSIYE